MPDGSNIYAGVAGYFGKPDHTGKAGVFQREDLKPGDAFAGPAVIEQYDTTTLVPAGFRASVDAWGNLVGEGEWA